MEAEDSTALRARQEGLPPWVILKGPNLVFLGPQCSLQGKVLGRKGNKPTTVLPSERILGTCAGFCPGFLPGLDGTTPLVGTHPGLRGGPNPKAAPREAVLNLSFHCPLTGEKKTPGECGELPKVTAGRLVIPKAGEKERKSRNLCWERGEGLNGLQKGLERSLSLANGSLQDFRETGERVREEGRGGPGFPEPWIQG